MKKTNDLFRTYRSLAHNFFDIGLRYEDKKSAEVYFCTPEGADIFASLGVGGIHYCRIAGFGETVFVVNPEAADEAWYVFPVAHSFEEFLRLVLALHGTQLMDQIPLWSREKFDESLAEMVENESEGASSELAELAQMFALTPLTEPYDVIKALTDSFDRTKLVFSDEYYDVLGIDRDEE